MKETVLDNLKLIIDPELGVDIVTLGLIRDIVVEGDSDEFLIAHILMTLTTPLCPFADVLIQDVETQVELLGLLPKVSLSFDPPWEMSEDVKLLLGI